MSNTKSNGKFKLLALIPSKINSTRVPYKNFIPFYKNYSLVERTRMLAETCIKYGLIDGYFVSTNIPDELTKDQWMLKNYKKMHGEHTVNTIKDPFVHSNEANDIDWIKHIFDTVKYKNLIDEYTHYIILRPTNPFKTVWTIRRAINEYLKTDMCISMKSVQPVKERPEKMWVGPYKNVIGYEYMNNYASLILLNSSEDVMPYELQSSNFQKLYVQNGCLDICPTQILKSTNFKHYIGKYIVPFFTEGSEGFNIDTWEDFKYAQYLVNKINEG